MYAKFFCYLLFLFIIGNVWAQDDDYEFQIKELERRILSLKNDLNIRNKIIFGLKQDNAYLKRKINLFEMGIDKKKGAKSINHFDSHYDFKVVNCFGDRLYQTVTINFLIRNRKGSNQLLMLDCNKRASVAYDGIGNSYSVKYADIGNVEKDDNTSDTLHINLPNDVYVRGNIVFRAVLGGTEFKIVRLAFITQNEDSTNMSEGIEEIKNIKIRWE